jgi:hypothetical protein
VQAVGRVHTQADELAGRRDKAYDRDGIHAVPDGVGV